MLQSFIPIALMKTGIDNDHLPPFISLRCYCSAPVQWLDVMGVWLGTLRRMAGVLVMLKDGRQQRNHRLEIATSGCLCSLHSSQVRSPKSNCACMALAVSWNRNSQDYKHHFQKSFIPISSPTFSSLWNSDSFHLGQCQTSPQIRVLHPSPYLLHLFPVSLFSKFSSTSL